MLKYNSKTKQWETHPEGSRVKEMYKMPQTYIERQLEKLREEERPKERLILDIAAVLTGPTCGNTANELARKLLQANDPRAVALTLRTIAERFLQGQPDSERE